MWEREGKEWEGGCSKSKRVIIVIIFLALSESLAPEGVNQDTTYPSPPQYLYINRSRGLQVNYGVN